jgi:hypothetical protein
MHMAWMRAVAGRLESRYQYSAGMVYNNFPWAQAPTAARVDAVELAATNVLAARERHAGSTLADMYDPLTMPADLRSAHHALDRAVDALYGYKGQGNDIGRVECLFTLFQKLTTLFAESGKTAKKTKRKKAATA